MLTASMITKYGITNIYDGYAMIDELFSMEANDPYMCAEDQAGAITNGQYFDITVAICPDYKCITQIIVFKNKQGWEKYIKDEIVIFDHKEI